LVAAAFLTLLFLVVGLTRIEACIRGDRLRVYDYLILISISATVYPVIRGRRNPTARWHRKQHRDILRTRKVRLCSIALHPDGLRRLPHRVLERQYLRSFGHRKRIRALIESVPPGTIIILGLESLHTNHPSSTALPFEPILLGSEPMRLAALDDDRIAADRPDDSATSPQSLSTLRAKFAKTVQIAIAILLSGIALAGLLFMVLGAAAGLLGLLALAARFGWPLLLLLPIAFRQIVKQRVRAWLVPAGMFFVKYRIWPPKEEITIAPVANSALLLDFVFHEALSCTNGRVVRFQPPFQLSPVLRGLRNTARTPSAEEIHSFLADREGLQHAQSDGGIPNAAR